MTRLLALVLALAILTPNSFGQVRTWTDATGSYRTEAEFAGLHDGVVRLKRSDGTLLSVPLKRLSEADRRWVLVRQTPADGPGAPASAEPPANSDTQPVTDLAAAVEKYWVAPYKDRLTFVMPWDSERPERARICPPGETRQIWLDLDGHKLPAGKHRFTATVSARRLDAAPPPDHRRMLARLQALAQQAEARSYWYPWRECNPKKEPCPHGRTFVAAVRRAGRLRALPEYVLWIPSPWIGIPPTLLPPSLKDDTRAETAFCLDEYEPICLTVTNLGETDLEFSVVLTPAAGDRAILNDPLVRRVELAVEVWPLRLPETSRLAVFTFNFGKGDPEHVAFLKRMKCNWFSLENPRFTLQGDTLTCDFRYTDASLRAVKPHGKGMFFSSLVMEFIGRLEKDPGIRRTDRRFEPLLEQFLTQFVLHMQQAGWKAEDYAVQLWDEPGLASRDDPEVVFPLIDKSARILREVEPDVRIMVNPLLKPDQLKYYAMIDGETAIWCPHGGAVYTTEDTRGLQWTQVQRLDPSKQGKLLLQGYLKTSRERQGTKLWTYFNRDFPYSPIVYYRHMPWKNKWMEFDGVSFFGSWYVTGGTLEDPNYLQTRQWWRYCLKDLYGWREGVEDVQYLEMVEDASLQARGADGRRLAAVYHRALKRVVDQGWWAKDPLLLEQAIRTSRRELAETLLREERGQAGIRD